MIELNTKNRVRYIVWGNVLSDVRSDASDNVSNNVWFNVQSNVRYKLFDNIWADFKNHIKLI